MNKEVIPSPHCIRPPRYSRKVEILTYLIVGGAVIAACRFLGFGTTMAEGLTLLVAETASNWGRWKLHGRHVRNTCLRALECELSLCLECGYSLVGLPAIHRCPECGREFALDETKSTWKQWLASRGTGRVERIAVEALEGYLQAVRNMRRRRSCIRCGHEFRGQPAGQCPECGAKNEIIPPESILPIDVLG